MEEEEQMRRKNAQEVQQRRDLEEHARWLAEVEATHEELLAQQKQRVALRERLRQDAGRAKQEQLQRIEAVAKARARARGLGTLGLDPDILAFSSKMARVGSVVEQVQRRMEQEYAARTDAAPLSAPRWTPAQQRPSEGQPWTRQGDGKHSDWATRPEAGVHGAMLPAAPQPSARPLTAQPSARHSGSDISFQPEAVAWPPPQPWQGGGPRSEDAPPR